MIYATSQASACKWHEAPVNSYLTGASPIFFEVALAHGRWSRVVRRAERNAPQSTKLTLLDCVSLIAPALLGAPSDARATGLHALAHGRCVGLLAPLAGDVR
jgi:hypothetical protein